MGKKKGTIQALILTQGVQEMGPQIDLPCEGESKVDLFQRREIRKTLHDGEWWFSVKDVLEALVDTTDGTRYVNDLKKRDPGLDARYSEITRALPFISAGGIQNTTFVNIEGIFRIMQSVPSTKAEPFKKWLAKVGFERLQETQNPELAIKRAIALYRAKGYDDEWIDARIRNKASRELLTSEWDMRGMKEYIGLLTDAISLGTFGIRTAEHKSLKGLKGQSLRDNMTPIELTLTTLGEQATREITKSTNPQTVQQHMTVADRGGRIAGSARRSIEHATGQPVVSKTNYLTARQRENNAQRNPKNLNEMLTRLLNPKPN
jgi:DNA-damage-inducible protein D